MGLHKLTAGDGYTYLTRQVAVQDATEKGHQSLGDYYAEHGESPGRWWGTGLTGLGLEAGSEVTETHMRNLFGAGRHPEAERLEAEARAAGRDAGTVARAGCLGRQFAVYAGAGHPLQVEVARRLVEHNCRHGRPWNAPVSTDIRARIRTEVTDQMFRDEHGRAPLDDRERAGFLARASRQRTTAVAGYDLTFTPVKSVSALWAVAPPAVAREVEAAHDAAVAAHLGVPGAGGAVHPPRPARRPAGQDAWPGDRPVHPPRLPLRRPEPSHPRRGQQQDADAGRRLARGRRPPAVQGCGHPVGDLQHPPRVRAAATAGRAVRSPRR